MTMSNPEAFFDFNVRAFYYSTSDPDRFVMIPYNRELKASLVHRPPEDRENWASRTPNEITLWDHLNHVIESFVGMNP